MAPTALAVICYVLLISTLTASPAPPQAFLQFQTSFPLFTFDSSFVSVNIDTASLDASMDLTDPSLINIIKQLGNVWLRFGGTSANTLVYIPDGPKGDIESHAHINDAYLQDIAYLQRSTNASILFGLPLQTNSDGAYDPTINATALWESITKHNIRIDGWSLGNELIGGSFNVTQYVSDYKTFAAALSKYPSIGQKIFGPSAAGFPGTDPLSSFFLGTSSFVSEFTFHAYAFGNCTLDVYVVKAGVERMQYYLTNYANLRNEITPHMPLVLEEAATQSGGGCEGLSDRFVSGFWWIHTLGMAAASGINRVHRQDVAGFSFNHRASHYMLAGVAGWVNASVSGPLSPHPDWFTTVLHKQLAGNAILNSSLTGSVGVLDNVAVHVWCAAEGARVPGGSITLSYINMGTQSNDTQLVLPSSFLSLPNIQYILTPGNLNNTKSANRGIQDPPQSLASDSILLNGELLTVGKDALLPVYPIPGKSVSSSSSLFLPAWSYGFIVLVGANVEACK